jgi:hypothetical protein
VRICCTRLNWSGERRDCNSTPESNFFSPANFSASPRMASRLVSVLVNWVTTMA